MRHIITRALRLARIGIAKVPTYLHHVIHRFMGDLLPSRWISIWLTSVMLPSRLLIGLKMLFSKRKFNYVLFGRLSHGSKMYHSLLKLKLKVETYTNLITQHLNRRLHINNCFDFHLPPGSGFHSLLECTFRFKIWCPDHGEFVLIFCNLNEIIRHLMLLVSKLMLHVLIGLLISKW